MGRLFFSDEEATRILVTEIANLTQTESSVCLATIFFGDFPVFSGKILGFFDLISELLESQRYCFIVPVRRHIPVQG